MTKHDGPRPVRTPQEILAFKIKMGAKAARDPLHTPRKFGGLGKNAGMNADEKSVLCMLVTGPIEVYQSAVIPPNIRRLIRLGYAESRPMYGGLATEFVPTALGKRVADLLAKERQSEP